MSTHLSDTGKDYR